MENRDELSFEQVRVTIDGGSEGKPLYAAEGELSELLPIPDTPTSFTLYLSAEAAAPASTADAAIARAATPTARLDAVGVRILHVLARPPESSSNALKAERTRQHFFDRLKGYFVVTVLLQRYVNTFNDRSTADRRNTSLAE